MHDIRVLLVDDEHDFILPLSRRLDRRGMETGLAHDAKEALEMLRSSTFDVVLLDIRMPKTDGIKTLMEIKRLHQNVQVVMLTAFGDSDTAISSLSMGAFGYLMKPVEMDVLLQTIAKASRVARQSGKHDG